MKKKSLLLLFMILLSFLIFGTITASAETVGYYTYSVSNGKATITDVSTSISGNITIPETLDGYPVTSIGDAAFFVCGSLTSITIPDSVTSIGKQAFHYCESLTSITIGNGVTSIGSSAFSNCSSLTSVTIGNGVTSIAEWAFSDCDRLTNVIIPDNVTSIGDSAFYDCSGLTSITIGNGVTTIDDYAFYNCNKLTNITIPDSVTSIGKHAFYNTVHYNKTSNWENGVLYIGNHLIKAKSSISEKYNIKPGTLTISGYAFGDCTSLTDITIPDSVISIGNQAFHYCESLTNITIPDSVTSIGYWTFADCTSLTSITIPNSVTSIGEYAFYNCDSLTDVYYKGTEEDWNNISIGDYNTDLKDATRHYVKFTKTTVDGTTFTVNPINIDEGSSVILSCYKGNMLTEIQTAEYRGEELTFNTESEYDKVYVFVWNNLGSMTSLTDGEKVK